MTYAKLILVLVAVFLAPTTALAHENHDDIARPPWQMPTIWPDRIVATIAGDPARSFSVSWRTNSSVSDAVAQIAPAIREARFDLAAETAKGNTQKVVLDELAVGEALIEILQNQGLEPVHYHTVTFDGLEPDTLYAYRVRGAWGAWSPWRQIRTAPLDGPMTFLFVGDAQTGIRSHVTRTFDAALRAAPDARFVMHGGDLVNTAFFDQEWAQWFEAIGAMAVTYPMLPTPGNHDYVNLSSDDVEDDKLFQAPKMVTPLWRPQFELPVVDTLPEDLAETVYDIRYSKDVHIFSVDSQGVEFDAQMDWLRKGLRESDATWKILFMHHPLYSFVGGREHPAHKERRLAIMDVLAEGNADMVMTGHRHSYQRGDIGDNVDRFQVGEPRSIDTVFLITATSTKRGESKVDGWRRFADETGGDYALRRSGDNIPLFAVMKTEGPRLSVSMRDAVGGEYDAFTLTKDSSGRKFIEDGTAAFGETATFDNTAPYRGWDDLR